MALPRTTVASTGTRSPDPTMSLSPARIAATLTATRLPSVTFQQVADVPGRTAFLDLGRGLARRRTLDHSDEPPHLQIGTVLDHERAPRDVEPVPGYAGLGLERGRDPGAPLGRQHRARQLQAHAT